MKTPPLLLGAALALWGWQTDLMIPALVFAAIVEGSSWVRFRLNLSTSDFNRIADFCTLLLSALFLYLFVTNPAARAILLLIQRLPLALMPLLFAQVFSTTERIDASALFMMLRRRKGKLIPRRALNLTYPYLALVLLAASAANVRTFGFYAGLFSLAVWGLWPVRPKKYSRALWITLLILAGYAGYAGQAGLHGLQQIIEDKATAFFMEPGRRGTDPYRSVTVIGEMGVLKMSGRIVARVQPEPGRRPPALLRTASYDAYRASTWLALHPRFRQLHPQADGSTWRLQSAELAGPGAAISEYLEDGNGLLKLPVGTFEIGGLPAARASLNQFGALKVEEGPHFASYRVRYVGGGAVDAPPGEGDLQVPPEEKPAIDQIARELGISSYSPGEALKAIDVFFQSHFKYSLNLRSAEASPGPVGDFLLHSRSGHCEYFATAATLLLRACGIPARYAVGYAVHEYSPREARFIVRERHAHAWTLAYLNGFWVNFDPTPPSWVNLENSMASAWEPVGDLWSWFFLKISEWRQNEGGGLLKYFFWALIPLGLLFLFRFWSRIPMKRTAAGKPGTPPKAGLDSEFYRIEEKLRESGYPRNAGEPYGEWVERLGKTLLAPGDLRFLREILDLHYRYRFDPPGLTPPERDTLRENVRRWLQQSLPRPNHLKP